MKRTSILITALLLVTAQASYAQLGDILRRVDPSKIKKGVNVAKAATKDFSEDEEANIGRVVSARVLATYPLDPNERLQKYVTLVGNTVAAYSSRPTLDWHFAVVKAPYVNAFSAPGGFIFITSEAIKNIHSEAELAAVLGHEIGHVTQKHILKEIKRANFVAAGVDLASSTAGGGFTDEIAQKIGNVAYDKLFKTGLGRGDELESDNIGYELSAAAGYRHDSMMTFLETLDQLEGKNTNAMSQLTKTHPKPADRISVLKPKIAEPEGGVLLAERFGTMLKTK